MSQEIRNTPRLQLAKIEWNERKDQFTDSAQCLLKQLGWQSASPLSWSLGERPDFAGSSLSVRQQGLKKKISAKDAKSFLDRSECWEQEVDSRLILLEGIQVAYGLDRLARCISSEQLKRLSEKLAKLASRFQENSSCPWLLQLAEVELPMVIAFQLDLPRENWVHQLELNVGELMDGDGWLLAPHHRVFGPLLCSWARCVQVMQHGELTLEDSVAIKLEWMARQWLRLLRPEGSVLLGPDDVPPAPKEMHTTILGLSSDREDSKLARLRIGEQKKKVKDESVTRLHDGAGFSEWAGLGVFQCGWKRDSPRVAIAIEETGLQLELANVTSLLKGHWSANVSVEGNSIEFLMDDYEINCYHSDEAVEFVELEYKSETGVILQRQIMMARDEQFLLLADAVILENPGRIEYRSNLPLSAGVESLSETDNREVYLKKSGIHSLVLPLALGEWRSDRLPGSLSEIDGKLTLQQQGEGTALYAPLFLDLSTQRCTSPRTWRSLTVAEELKILGKDKAVAYRVQVGEQQWVIYRSLSGIASRTFFGENQICEFFVGKTDADVAAEELIQIE